MNKPLSELGAQLGLEITKGGFEENRLRTTANRTTEIVVVWFQFVYLVTYICFVFLCFDLFPVYVLQLRF